MTRGKKKRDKKQRLYIVTVTHGGYSYFACKPTKNIHDALILFARLKLKNNRKKGKRGFGLTRVWRTL